MPFKQQQTEYSVPKLIRRLLLSWIFAFTLEFFLLPASLRDLSGLKGLAGMSLPRILIVTLAGLAVLTAAEYLGRGKHATSRQGQLQVERWAMVGLLLVNVVLSLLASFTWAFLGGCALLLGIAAVYARRGWQNVPPPQPIRQTESKRWLRLLVGGSLAFFLFDSLWMLARIRSFGTPSYDFGIFSQMFYYMKKTGLPLTTLERDGLLSHFRVHVSPIWYLMLPFYWIVPQPATLQILQAAILASSVIPLWKLCKLHGLPAFLRLLLCSALLLYPALSGGTSYDVHENCFLTPLLLWLLYGIDCKNLFLTGVAAILTLCVKEDAASYLAVIALWLSLRSLLCQDRRERRMLWLGLGLLAAAVLWFLIVTSWLAKEGDGVMTYRYSNFMYDGSDSLLTVVKSILLQPFKAVYECTDAEKLSFIALSLLPLLGLPLWTRRYERYLLLIPFLLVNLMSDYQYQHDIFFQYNFGSAACLFYLTAVNLAELQEKRAKQFGVFMVMLCAVCFGFTVLPSAMGYCSDCIQESRYYTQLREELSRIPENASVSAATFYTTELSQREILYDVKFSSFPRLLETEYIVLAPEEPFNYTEYTSPGAEDGLQNLIRKLEQHGYEKISSEEDLILVYQKP